MYATNPALYDRALAKFEQDIQKNPNDELLKMAYAQLLESKDMQKAIKIYESILEKNPNNKDVLFNLGALYNNAGKEKYDKANKSSDNNEYKKLLDEAKADFKKALTYIEKSYQLSENASVQDKKAMLKALVQICTLLEENEKLKTYKAAFDALK
jgi:tetratricopeptide (TPR) repeat protein